MGHGVCLQPWTTVTADVTTVVQDEAAWVDITPFKDVVIYTEVSEVAVSTSVVLQVQTSPDRQDANFSGYQIAGTPTPYIASYTFTSSPATPLQPLVFARFAQVTDRAPPGRFLRWRIVFGDVSNEITFRIWLNLNSGGR